MHNRTALGLDMCYRFPLSAAAYAHPRHLPAPHFSVLTLVLTFSSLLSRACRYTLTASILGFVAAFRRHLCSATAFYAMNVLDFILNVGIGVISWFAGASFTSLLAQIPSLAIAGYFLVVVKSYRQELLAEKAGGSGGMASSSRGGGGVISHGEDEDDEDGVNAADLAGVAGGSASSGGGRGKQVQVAIADDDEDGDISRGGRVTKL